MLAGLHRLVHPFSFVRCVIPRRVGLSQSSVRQRIAGIMLQRPVEECNGAAYIFRLVEILQIPQATQVVVISRRLTSAVRNQGVTITYPELQAKHVYDAFDDTILQAEDVAHVGGYGVGGELSHAGRIHQAISDSDPFTRLLQGALQHQSHSETLAGLFYTANTFRANLTCGNNLERGTARELSKFDG